MVFKNLVFIFLLFIISAKSSNANVADDIKLEQLEAVFILKFTHYIEWPASSEIFHIGVLSNPSMYEALREIFEEKNINGKKVKVSNLTKIIKDTHYNIIYVKEINSSILRELTQLKKPGSLIITHSKKGLHEFAIINFFIEEGQKLRFEINNSKARLNELEINSRLLNLSRNQK